ncbi:MAG: PLP-dependent cysteine synthase family protein [Pirellulaceae bacterium]
MNSSVENIAALVGTTPLLRIEYEIDGRTQSVFAKYESENMTGSVKDRMALHIIRSAYADGSLKPGDTIVEASSGNTGISFAAIGRALGHDVRVYMPNWMSSERVQLIHSFGAEVVPVSHEQGGFVGSVELAKSFAASHSNCFLPLQFENNANLEAHETGTGPEVERQLEQFGVTADAFVAGVGTGGTVMGVGRYLRRNDSNVFVHPLEPANSPTLRTGKRVGTHRIQGISDEFIPALIQLDELDEIVDVWDGDAILMAQQMCQRLGLAVGISSGSNILGAIKLKNELGDKATVVTLLPDSNKKYLSTDLCRTEPIKDEYLTPYVELKGFVAKR